MRIQIIIALAFIWIVGGIIGDILEGQYIQQADVRVIQDMTSYRILDSQGFMGIPIMGIEFFKELPNLIAFKYDWLTSGFVVIRFIMMCIALGIIYGLAQTFVPVLFNAAGGLLRRWF